MEKIKDRFSQVNEYLERYSKRTKVLTAVGVVAVIALAIGIAAFLNHTEYEVLFSGINEDEASTIVSKLQEDGIEYEYKDNGDILVDSKVADETRATLVFEGYPKSGFTYDVFTENAGGMTTDTEKEQYKLYELQDRIGATIRYFDGVKDAKVTIALAEEQKYVLQDGTDTNTASASVVVAMEDGGSPSTEQALAIQRLVAQSVPNMEMDEVGVFDGNGIEVSTQESNMSSEASQEIAQLIESETAKKVINILAPFFGADNIKVSATGTVNTEKIIRETITYSTPEKIDQEDKTGIVDEETTSIVAADGSTAASGVAGTETNAEATQYNGTSTDGEGTLSETATRDYLVNEIREQGEIQEGTLEDLTISVSINSETLNGVSQNELRDLVGNATGIDVDDREDNITVVNAPFYEGDESDAEGSGDSVVPVAITELIQQNPLLFAIGAGVLLLLIIVISIIAKIKGKKRRQRELEEDDFILGEIQEERAVVMDMPKTHSDRTRELREVIRGFTDENPEISAQMLRTWLNGGDENEG